MIDWSDIPVFLAVHEHGSHTAAARELNVSQPTIGRRISAMEEKLGAPLFLRENGALDLTAFGQTVLDHARRMEDEAGAIARAAVSRDMSLAGPVVFAASEGVGAEWLPRALGGFKRANPDILIEMNIGNQPANLAQRQADIALRWNGPGTQQSLIGRRAVSIGAGLYAAKSYLDARGRPERPGDLVDHDAVEWSVATKFTWPPIIDGENALPARITFQANSPNALLSGLVAGFGLGVYTHRMARRQAELERVLPEYETSLDLWIVTHEDVRRSARIRAAFDYTLAALDADAAHFSHGEPSIYGPS
tara:strand:- start:1793 stop:2710 length:918 start_codon:yes stop_codon:yes gene_type:complete